MGLQGPGGPGKAGVAGKVRSGSIRTGAGRCGGAIVARTKGLMEPAKHSRQVISPRTVHSAASRPAAVAHWTRRNARFSWVFICISWVGRVGGSSFFGRRSHGGGGGGG